MMITVYIDGACEPRNPNGIATYGFVIRKDGWQIQRDLGVVGEGEGMSNNVAEYSALRMALKWLLERALANERIVVFSDSKLVVRQMRSEWRVRQGLYVEKYKEAFELVKHFSEISFEWISRKQNKEADQLSRDAYEKYCREKGMPIEYVRERYGK